jgi:2-phospho-L-lactate guanylyltransferase
MSVTRWVVVVPVKVAERAKSRLAAYAGELRADLARAFALDCLGSVVRTPGVVDVVVVTDDVVLGRKAVTLGCLLVPDTPRAGLNAAAGHGAQVAARRHPEAGVAVLAADLPALRPEDLARALASAGRHARAFVSDRHAFGTNLLTVSPGLRLDPRFEGSSAVAHHDSGAVSVPGPLDTIRTDVDDRHDLQAARLLGLGPATHAVVDQIESARSAR